MSTAIDPSPSSTYVSPESPKIRGFFDSIASRYDFLNTFLSLRLDERWRKKSCGLLLEGGEKTILDLGIGTGKFAELFLKPDSNFQVVGLDFSVSMLGVAQKNLNSQLGLVNGDFHFLPFRDQSFDLIVSSFTLRSVKQMERFLKEIHRLLSSKGKVGFLCLTRPKSWWWNILYLPYLKFYIPLVGRLVSGSAEAYRFLSDSIQNFQEPEATRQMMLDVGFKDVKLQSFSFGSATLIIGRK